MTNKLTATFQGYMGDISDNLAIFNVKDGNRVYTWGTDTLIERGIEIPTYPSFEEWVLTNDRKKGFAGVRK